MTNIIEALNWRYATKKFDPHKKISENELKELLEALRLSASSYGLQPWKFLVITNKRVREELRKAAYGQPQITDASHLVVLCARTDLDENYVRKFVESIADTRETSVDTLKEYEQTMAGSVKNRPKEAVLEWSSRQVYIALGTLLTAAASMKIDSCPMEGFDNEKFDEILGLGKKHLTSVVLCPVGYRGDDDYADAKKVRFPSEKIIERLD